MGVVEGLARLGKSGRIFGASLAVALVLAAFLVVVFGSFGSSQSPPPEFGFGCTPGSFVVRGTVLNSTYGNATSYNTTLWGLSGYNSSVNVSIYNVSMSQFGSPQKVFINQTNTSRINGSFILNVGHGNCDTVYTLSILVYNSSGWNVLEVGPSLPPLPKSVFVRVIDNGTFYTESAVTVNLTASNGTDMISFSNVIFDDSLGFPISEDFDTLRFNTSVVLPIRKNYTIMMMKPPQWSSMGDPFSTALPPQTILLNNLSNYSAGMTIGFNKSLAFSQFFISGNISIDGTNTTAVNVTQILLKLGLSGMVPPNSDIQMSNAVSLNNTPSRGPGHIANFSIVVMGSASGIYQILEFYGGNATSTASGDGEYFAYISNFTVTGNMGHNLTLKRLAGNYSVVSGFTNLNTSFVRVNITDSAGLPLDDAHVEIRVDMIGHKSIFPTFRYMADQLSGGVIRLPIINNSNATVQIFNRRYAPAKYKLNVSNASREPNGIINIKLNTFSPRKFHANGSSEDFSGAKASGYKFSFLRNSASCNVFNASLSSCRLFNDDFDAGKFDPLKVMATGKVNLLMEINTTGVKIYFIGVDMIASGPPEASMSENALSQTFNSSSYKETFKWGSAAPNIYDNVFVGIPYNASRVNDARPMNFSIRALYDETGRMVWNSSVTPNSSIPSEWSDYDTRWFNTTSGGMPCTEGEGLNSTNATCFINTTTNYVWINLPHFSDGDGGPQGDPDTIPAVQPASVNISALPGGSVQVNWTDSAGETGETYIIFRSATNISTLRSNLTNYSGTNGVINVTNITAVGVPEGTGLFIDNQSVNGSLLFYAVLAVDSAGNLQNSSYGVNVSNSYNVTVNDTVIPRVPSNVTLSVSDTTVTVRWVNVTQDVIGGSDFYNLTYYVYRSAANQTANLSAGNVTLSNISTFVRSLAWDAANTTTVTGLENNAVYHFAVVTADDGGNVNLSVLPSANYANITTPVPSGGGSSSSSSSSSGGGGGGGGTPSVAEGVKFTKSWDALPAGPTTLTVTKDEIGFKAIDFTLANDASKPEITVVKLASKPTVKREVQGKAYQYIRIDKSNIKETDVSNVKIEFKVEKKWFDENSGSIKDIVLQRYFNDLWTSLDTVYLRQDATHQYFQATSPGLSLFAIVLKSPPKADVKLGKGEGAVNVSGGTGLNASGNESGAAAGAEGKGKGKAVSVKTLVFAALAVVAIAAVGAGVFLVIRKKGGGGFSLPNPFSRFGGSGGRGSEKSRSSKSEEDEAAEIVREYESQRKPQRQAPQSQDQRGRPPEAFN